MTAQRESDLFIASMNTDQIDLNYNFECDCIIELSDNKLSDTNLISELLENRSFFKPITIEGIVIFIINYIRC